ncbi:MFS transporter [Streptomyces sulphureus]|uniref:MFS transporter n=1 Tax=Streptomyces sulphureus TaxID=47758 RepID=UPI000365D9D1|nr:MFS transporter [Streptomyces sulphureus]
MNRDGSNPGHGTQHRAPDAQGARPGAPPPRGALRLVFDRDFGTFFWGKLLTSTGVWAHSMVAAIVAFQASGSALAVGAVSAGQFAPQLLLTPLSGKLTDRGHAMGQLVAGRALSGLGSGGLALWILAFGVGDGVVGVLPILASSLIVGCGFAVGGPAMQSAIPWIIRPGELARAMALNTAPMTLSRAVGPALGALLVAHVSPVAAFGAAACAHLLFALGLLAVRLPSRTMDGDGADTSLRAAFRHLRADRPLALLLLGIVAVGVGSEPATTLVPSMAEEFGGSAALAGWLASAFGIGAALGLPLLAVVRRVLPVLRLGSAGLVLLAVGLAGSAVGHSGPMTLAALGVAGVGLAFATTGLSTLVQERAPDQLRGRIMALWLTGFVGSRPLAAGLDGLLADAASPAAAFAASAVLVLAVAWMVRPASVDRPIPGRCSDG